MTNEEALERAYTQLSPFSDCQRWEFHNNLVHLRYITKWVRKDQRILDAGCGIGILSVALLLLGYHVEGADKYIFQPNNQYSIGDIAQLQAVWKKFGLRITERDFILESIPQSFDCIISIATIEHIKDPKFFLSTLQAQLVPGGSLYVATPNLAHLLNRIRFLFGRSPMLHTIGQFFKEGDRFTGHWREYTLPELISFFQWLDFDHIKGVTMQSMPPFRRFKNMRELYVDLARLLAYILPGTGDTNIIFARRKK